MIGPEIRTLAALVCVGLLAGCGPEKRAIGPAAPMSAPIGADDPRAALYETNAYQISEGGRMFLWHGCTGCHAESSPEPLSLTDKSWRYGGSTEAIYASIEHGRPGGMPAYGKKIPTEQIWQIAGFVHGLPQLPKAKRIRQGGDLAGEGRAAQGPRPTP